MNTKTCSMCNIEKHINNFYKIFLQHIKKFSECRDCKHARRLKGYYENKGKISNQQKIFKEKNRDKILLQKQNKRCIQFRDLVISYVELENRLKASEEKSHTQQIEKGIDLYYYLNGTL